MVFLLAGGVLAENLAVSEDIEDFIKDVVEEKGITQDSIESVEKGTFEEVTKLRSQWGKATNSDKKMKTANMLEGALSKLLVVQERYPKLKADKSFQNIQKSIGWVERELVRERKLYNRRVSSYNVKLQEFPSNIIGKMFGFKEKEFFGKPDASLE